MKQTVNVNRIVKVKLTPYGIKIWNAHCNHYNINCEIKYDKKGYAEFHLWDLMKIFGHCFYMGNIHIPFENNNIILTDKD